MIFCSVAEMDNIPEVLTLSELMAGQKIVKGATHLGRYSVHRHMNIPHTSPSFSNCIDIYSTTGCLIVGSNCNCRVAINLTNFQMF